MKIGIIGNPGIGKTLTEIKTEDSNETKEVECLDFISTSIPTILYKPIPTPKIPFIDPHAHIPNHQKHIETCLKNKKKRKNKHKK